MERWAYGARLSPDVFWEFDFEELGYAIGAENEAKADQWRQTRAIMLILLNRWRDPKKQPIPFSPTDIMRLPGDPDPIVIAPLSDEEFDRIANKYRK